jgi:hypothetical protein
VMRARKNAAAIITGSTGLDADKTPRPSKEPTRRIQDARRLNWSRTRSSHNHRSPWMVGEKEKRKRC